MKLTSKILRQISVQKKKKNISLPPPIKDRGVRNSVSVRAKLIGVIDPENFSFKSIVNSLKI